MRDVDLNGDGLVDFEGKPPQKNRAQLMFPKVNLLVSPLRVRTNDVSLGS